MIFNFSQEFAQSDFFVWQPVEFSDIIKQKIFLFSWFWIEGVVNKMVNDIKSTISPRSVVEIDQIYKISWIGIFIIWPHPIFFGILTFCDLEWPRRYFLEFLPFVTLSDLEDVFSEVQDHILNWIYNPRIIPIDNSHFKIFYIFKLVGYELSTVKKLKICFDLDFFLDCLRHYLITVSKIGHNIALVEIIVTTNDIWKN